MVGEAATEDSAEGAEEFEAEEETAPVRTMTTPYMPSEAEVERHRLAGHTPYRPWCDACVEGRGQERGHFSETKREKEIPTISFDYLFLSKQGFSSPGRSGSLRRARMG